MSAASWSELVDAAQIPEALPVLPLRNAVLFPQGQLPVAIGRTKPMQAARAAPEGLLFVVAQRDDSVTDPQPHDLFATGTVARIRDDASWSGDSATLTLVGLCRAKVEEWTATEPFLRGRVSLVREQPDLSRRGDWLLTLQTAVRQLLAVDLRVDPRAAELVDLMPDPESLADLLAANLLSANHDKQILLEANPADRIERIVRHLDRLQGEARRRPLSASDRLRRLWRRLLG